MFYRSYIVNEIAERDFIWDMRACRMLGVNANNPIRKMPPYNEYCVTETSVVHVFILYCCLRLHYSIYTIIPNIICKIVILNIRLTSIKLFMNLFSSRQYYEKVYIYYVLWIIEILKFYQLIREMTPLILIIVERKLPCSTDRNFKKCSRFSRDFVRFWRNVQLGSLVWRIIQN